MPVENPDMPIESNLPVCSVCIANYNGIGVIEDCLNSVLQQEFDFPVEIIVHDDASTDGSVEFIRNNFSNVTLITSAENVGFCVSNNRMAERARGKYILLLNNDAMLFPDALRTFYEHAEKEQKPAILGLRQYDASTNELIEFGFFLDPFLNSVPNLDLKLTDTAYVMGACLWAPKELWNSIGGFPEWFESINEDVYLCCRARLHNYPVKMLGQSGYKHWVGRSLGGGKVVSNRLSSPLKRRALSERNRLYVMSLCYPNPLFYLVLPLHISLLILEGFLLSFIKRDINILKSIYLHPLKTVWLKRKELSLLRREIHKLEHVSGSSFLSAVRPIPYKCYYLSSMDFQKLLKKRSQNSQRGWFESNPEASKSKGSNIYCFTLDALRLER